MNSSPILYSTVAPWFHLLTRPEDYAEEAGIFSSVIREFMPSAVTVLELGSGGGNNAFHMKRDFQLTLVDISPAMLEISKTINPELPHHQGDMRTYRCADQFDAVFIHDAIMYMTSEMELSQAMATAFQHVKPGGIALFVPDCTLETFRPSTSHGGHDSGSGTLEAYPGKSLRYLEWTYDPDTTDNWFVADFAYLLKEEPDQVKTYYDRHVMGLFSYQTWLRLLEETGFKPHTLPFNHSEVEPGMTTLFIGQKKTR